jgi:hypothetical protein
MDTRYFKTALFELDYTGRDLSTREISAALQRAQELKQIDTDRASRLGEQRHQDARLILRHEAAKRIRAERNEAV